MVITTTVWIIVCIKQHTLLYGQHIVFDKPNSYPLFFFYIAMENGPFMDDLPILYLPIKHDDFL